MFKKMFKTILLFAIAGIITAMFSIFIIQYFNLKRTKTICLHEKMQECIDAGGKYNLNYSNYYGNRYKAKCEIPEKTLFEFYLKEKNLK